MAMRFLKRNKIITFTSFILIVWILLALVRTGLNFSKVLSEEISWISLTRIQKEELLFGDLYTFFSGIDQKTAKRSRILLYSTDGKAYFYGRYYLYPKGIYWAKTVTSLNRELQTKRYDYLAIYNFDEAAKKQLIERKVIGNFTIITSKFGELFKIQ